MTGFILAMTLTFPVLHMPTGTLVHSVTTETFQAPLASLEECNYWAARREESARQNLAMIGITEVIFDHSCLPAPDEES